MKEAWVRVPSLCALGPVQPVTYLPPPSWGSTDTCSREPQRPPNSTQICIFPASSKMKKGINFLSSLNFSSQPQLIQYWSFPDTAFTTPERALAFALGCDSAFCMSPSNIHAQTELPVHPRLCLPCFSWFCLLPLTGDGSQDCWQGSAPALTLHAQTALSGSHQLQAPPRLGFLI